MNKLATFALATFLATPIFAADIPLPFNAGELDNGTVAADGTVDAHYTDTISGNTVYVNSGRGAGSNSAWVAPDTSWGGSYNGGNYDLDYRTTIDLTGYDPSSVVIKGGWLSDNYGSDILVNGSDQGNVQTAPDFYNLYPFTLDAGFRPGINTIDFQWSNYGGPGGLIVDFTSATGDPVAASATPEPASLLLFGLGASAVGLIARRRRQA